MGRESKKGAALYAHARTTPYIREFLVGDIRSLELFFLQNRHCAWVVLAPVDTPEPPAPTEAPVVVEEPVMPTEGN